ncbi:MAG: ABC transporter ATP-binding protein, partial [Thermoflexaceae bacterium]|nr:ABC transporter ATP-binding protein [Thermoflexaceae bacterium]
MDDIIELRGLAAGYGATPVISGVDFRVQPGEFVGIV